MLLDTNIVVSVVNETVGRLPARLRAQIERPAQQPWVSVVSIWEIAIKTAAGKLELALPTGAVGPMLRDAGVRILPMTEAHAVEVAHPEPATRDPFDRLLLAICACEGLKLLTTDSKLAGHRLVV